MTYGKIMKQLKSFNFTDAQRKKLASIILKLDKEKQDILISGDNIATINGQSLLNGGNISLIKTGIFSIVTELPTNDIDKDKVYLVPSTETDNENKFSEYIYTDNGWEELGTFTADVDLSPYERALNLPSDVVKTLRAHSGANYVNVYSYKQDLDRGQLHEVSEFNIPKATSENAGIITAQDKAKLDGIEEGAQVNTIESISVNGTPLDITNKGVNIPLVDTKNAGILPAINNTSYSPSFLMTNINPVTYQRNYKWGSIDIASFILNNKDVDIRITNVGNITFSNIFSEGIEIGSNNNRSIHFKVILNPSINNILTLDDEGLFVDKTSIDTGVTGIKLAGYTSDKDITLDIAEGIVRIPLATVTTQGLMDVADKTKLDSLENYTLPAATKTTLGGVRVGNLNGQIPSILHTDNYGNLTARVSLYYIKDSKTLKLVDYVNDSEISTINCADFIKDGPNASITENGLMSKEDKAKLDSQPTIKASDATGVTDDDYVVIKKSELNSILSRLSALENKA